MSDAPEVPQTVALTNTNSQGGVFLPELGRDLLAGHVVEVAAELGEKLLAELAHFGIGRADAPADAAPAEPAVETPAAAAAGE